MAGSFAEIQEALGDFGKFQRRACFLTIIPSAFCAMAALAYVFLAAPQQYRCFIEGCDNPQPGEPQFEEPWLSRAIPHQGSDEGLGWDSCFMFNHSSADGVGKGAGVLAASKCPLEFDKNTTVECSKWVFDKSEFVSTIVSQWSLTCARGRVLVPLSQTLLFAGSYLGGTTFGIMSDVLGRRLSLGLAMLVMGISGTALALSPNYITYVLIRFIIAAGAQGCYQTAFVLGVELVGPSKRPLFGVIISYAWAVGGIVLAGLAFVIRDWQWLAVSISAPIIPCLLYFLWLPESISWLISKGKYEKAVATIEWAERVNRVTVPKEAKSALSPNHNDSAAANEIEQMKTEDAENKVPGFWQSFRLLCTSRILVFRSLIVLYLWVTIAFVFYGMNLNATLIGGSLFINFVSLQVAEIPAYTLAWFLMDCWGRRAGTSASLAVGGVAVVATAALRNTGNYWLLVILYMIGKAGGTSAFAIVYVHTAEMYPTSLRTVVVAMASLVAGAGNMLAPFMGSLQHMWTPLPLYIFGGLSLLGAGLSMLLVETRGSIMPQTIEEAERLGKK